MTGECSVNVLAPSHAGGSLVLFELKQHEKRVICVIA